MFQHTIAAISTALQDGAISIIRLSGDEAISIVQSIFSKNILDAKSHTIHYGFIWMTTNNLLMKCLFQSLEHQKHIPERI